MKDWINASRVSNFIYLIEQELFNRGFQYKKDFVSSGNWVKTKKAYLKVERGDGEDKVKIIIARDGKNGFICVFNLSCDELLDNVEAFTILLL